MIQETLTPVLLVVAIGAAMTIIWFMKYQNGVKVLGIDFSSGYVALKTLLPNKEGAVNWRRPDKSKTLVPIDSKHAKQWSRGQFFFADVTPGQGRLMNPVSAEDWPRVSGDRSIEVLAAGLLRQAAQAANNREDSILFKIAVVAAVVFIAVLGGAVYVIKMLSDRGAL